MYWWYPMQISLKKVMLAMALMGTVSAQANIQVFPAKGIYGLELPCRQSVEHIEANASSISCDFSKAVTSEAIRTQVAQTFEQQLKQALQDQVVTSISQQNKHRSYVASLEVLRASETSREAT